MKIILILISILFFVNKINSQDIIKKTNGEEIKAKVMEITSAEIKYKKFTNQDGPTYTVSISTVQYIKYKNGDIDKFNTGTVSTNATNVENNNSNESQANNQNEIPVNNQSDNYNQQNQNNNTNQQIFSKSYNLNHDVLKSEFITINSEQNKDKIISLIANLNSAIVAGNYENAWKIMDEIDGLNK